MSESVLGRASSSVLMADTMRVMPNPNGKWLRGQMLQTPAADYLSISAGMKWVKYLLTDTHPYQVYGLLIIYMTPFWNAEITKPYILSVADM